NGTPRPSIARLNADGSLDSSFAPTGSGLDGPVWALAIDGAGRVVVGGGDHSFTYIARLNANGIYDYSFSPPYPPRPDPSWFEIGALAIDGSGRVVVGGFYDDITRLNADGSLDSSFAPTGSGRDGPVGALAIDGSGRIVVGGFFTSYNGTPRPSIARLNADGSLDSSFAPTGSGPNGSVLTVATDDERVVVGGYFTIYGSALARYYLEL
ncbi:MAG: hypothetical protein HY901_23280, partial [Deltaproteobacteria bacterium]|nr:hypothetical protein [Deltaproteobacteria bacterium]